MAEELIRKTRKNILAIGLILSETFLIYNFFSPNDRTDKYYNDYLSEIGIVEIEAKYEKYIAEVDRVTKHKNKYLTASILNGVLLTYVLFFEKYTDFSEQKGNIQNQLSLKSTVLHNNLALNLTLEF